MWPVKMPPSQVSRVNLMSPSRTTLTSKLVPPVSQTIEVCAEPACVGHAPATGAIAGPELTE